MERIIVATLFLGLCLCSTCAVKIRTFYVPGKAGNEAPLLCTYDLEDDTLYDVKWYKDGEQFYRCEPNGLTTAFDVDGVRVQLIKFAPLGSCSLTLMMLTQKTAGEYRCEVNTEGPKFDTASESKKMLILEPVRRRVQNTSAPTATIPNTVVQYQQTQENKNSYDAASLHLVNHLNIVFGVFSVLVMYIY